MLINYLDKYYDGLAHTPHSEEAKHILLSSEKRKMDSMTRLFEHNMYPRGTSDNDYNNAKEQFELNKTVLSFEIAFVKTTSCYQRMQASPFISDMKHEWEAFLMHSVINGPLIYSHNGKDIEKHLPNETAFLDRVHMGRPFVASDIHSAGMGRHGIQITVASYWEGDGYGTDETYFTVPSADYREMTPEEMQVASIIIADSYPDLFHLQIRFFEAEEKRLLKRDPVKVLDYCLDLAWGPMKPFPYKKPSAPTPPKKDLY